MPGAQDPKSESYFGGTSQRRGAQRNAADGRCSTAFQEKEGTIMQYATLILFTLFVVAASVTGGRLIDTNLGGLILNALIALVVIWAIADGSHKAA